MITACDRFVLVGRTRIDEGTWDLVDGVIFLTYFKKKLPTQNPSSSENTFQKSRFNEDIFFKQNLRVFVASKWTLKLIDIEILSNISLYKLMD